MQATSHGAWRGPRRVLNPFLGISPGHGARSIHIPAYARLTSSGAAKRITSQTRFILSRLVGHLTAPGLSATPVSFQQAIRGSAPGRMSSIQGRLSYAARHALARPAQPHFFARPATFVSRSVAQVGLGTARNFSSGRSVFQNFVENVPIAGRALYEADWDIHMQAERDAIKKSLKGTNAKAERSEMLKPKQKQMLALTTVPESIPESISEMDQYFTNPIPAVTTMLLVPLAPTPTGRAPLPADVSDHASLLPLPSLASIHNSHEMHSLRVSALFSRLDAAHVWEKGVLCSAYSEPDIHGLCTVLQVEFVGWTASEVRGIIGESGTGWCAIEEIKSLSEDDLFSDVSSIFSGLSDDEGMGSPLTVEPAHSLVLPTLDFSSSFANASPSPSLLSRGSSNHDLLSEAESDPWVDSFLDESWVDHGYLEFSSDFVNRLGPRKQWSSESNVSE
ncbi:hypothetical protein D9757_007224 [Collybiopsis confluens]|uniref:Uncharacterized protein n=1 Tax=Collybiopsis confluens TaxID=2823264 RepID=A0A8H5HAY2_9AGAR|nr:hypothetical protein D9757_007224 [Collybiopsis confluens]